MIVHVQTNIFSACSISGFSRLGPERAGQLEASQAFMQQLKFSATPTTFYKDADGLMKTIQGASAAEKLFLVLRPR